MTDIETLQLERLVDDPEIRRAAAKTLKGFCLTYLPHHFPLDPSDFFDDMCRALEDHVLKRVAAELAKHNVSAEVVPVAPFSDAEEIRAGFGLASLIEATVRCTDSASSFWPVTPPKLGERSFLSYRRDQ